MKNETVKCAECGAERKQITSGHVRTHGLKDIYEYLKKYPGYPTISEQTLFKRRHSRRLVLDSPAESQPVEHDFYVSKARTRKRISYDEFLDMLKQNISLSEMKKEYGVSKHQIGFYSSLAQNKITIKREQFEEEYKSGQSLDQISKKYGIQRDHITQLREFWGIKRLGPKYINRKKTEKPLSRRQQSIIYGGLMGDAGGSCASIKMKQSIKQRWYLLWKYAELKEHISPVSLQITANFDKRYSQWYHNIRFYTHANTGVEEIVNKFYPNGQKVVTDDILNHIDDLALAIWFMDDGTTDWYERNSLTRNPTCKFCTDSFYFEETQLICTAFEEMWGISTEPSLSGKSKKDGELQYRVKLNVPNTQKLFKTIEPYIIPSMKYKINRDAYHVWKKQEEERKILEKIDRDSIIRKHIGEIDEFLKKNHADQNGKLNIFANKHINELFFKKGENKC